MAALPCRNCGTPPGSGEYCPGCGQRNRHWLLRSRELLGDVFDQILEWRLPWPKTMLDLMWRPGAVALEYIEGRRARYVNPVKYCFIVVAVALVFEGSHREPDPYLVDLPANVLALLSVPFQVGLLCLCFWRSPRTPTEISVLSLFVTAQLVVLYVLVAALFALFESLGLPGDQRGIPIVAPILGLFLANSIYAVRTFFSTAIAYAVGVTILVGISTLILVTELDWLLVRGEFSDFVKYTMSGGG